MTGALLLSIVVMALAGAPHCATMCGAPCAALLGPQPASSVWFFHAARLAGYAAAGAALAAGLSGLGEAATASRALAPLWTLWHAAGLCWGLWMLWRGQQPSWVEDLVRAAPLASAMGPAWQPVRWAPPMRRAGPLAAMGLAWVAWPCGLLQSALVVASLGGTALAGAGLMGLFAAITGLGLALAPALWQRWLGGARSAARAQFATRVAGFLLVAACLWALAQRSGLVAFCLAL
jgi:uncharacterized protein